MQARLVEGIIDVGVYSIKADCTHILMSDLHLGLDKSASQYYPQGKRSFCSRVRLSSRRQGGQHREQAHYRISAGRENGVVVLPGLGNNKKDYEPLAALLRERDLVVEIADVSRPDWLRNAAGVIDGNYWKGTLNPRPVVDWYLTKVDNALQAVLAQTDNAPVTLLAHSAGGWLGRVYMLGFGPQGKIQKFISLGSPHLPPTKGSKAVDQTRGILTHVEENCPGCFHEEVQYVSVVGRYIKGSKFRDKEATWRQKAVGLGYQQVCGAADVWGDGVVPEPSAHLPGALQITLEDVYHSPVGSRDGTGSQKARLWYGSEPVLDQWFQYLVGDAKSSDSGVVDMSEVMGVTLPLE